MNYSENAISKFNNANNFYKIERYEEALKLYKEALDIDLSFYEAHFCVAKTYSRLKKIKEAIEAFKLSLKFMPNSNEERNQFTYGFLNILQQDGFSKEAITFFESINYSLTPDSYKKYLELLLQEGNTDNFYKVCFKAFDIYNQETVTKEVLTSSYIPQKVKDQILKDKAFENIKNIQRRIKLIEEKKFDNTKFRVKIRNLSQELTAIQNGNFENLLASLSSLNSKIADVPNDVFGFFNTYKNNLAELQKIHTFLKNNDFDKGKLKSVADQIEKLQEAKKKRVTKGVLVAGSAIAVIIVALFIFNYFYQKSEAKKDAIQTKNIVKLDAYIEKYGDNEEVNKLRERIYYTKAVQYKDTKSISNFTTKFPSSKYLRIIKLIAPNNENYQLFAANSRFNRLKPTEKNLYKIPFGVHLGLGASNETNPLALKYFTVSKNMTINLADTIKPIHTLPKGALLYVNARKLNVRTGGYGHTDILEQIERTTPVIYQGEHTENKVTATFFGQEVSDYYYKIQTKTNYGWVHGAGLNYLETDYDLKIVDFYKSHEDILQSHEDSSGYKKLEKLDSSLIESFVETTFIEDTTTLEEPAEILEDEKETPVQNTTNQPAKNTKENSKTATEVVKPKKQTCTKCSGNGITKRTCNECNYGTLTTDCATCSGNYRSGKGLCKKCSGLGCDYCDYDGAACGKCNSGKISSTHKKCNGSGKISTQCTACGGKGFVLK